MALIKIPDLVLPEGTRFFLAIFLAAFFYFFTQSEPVGSEEKKRGV